MRNTLASRLLLVGGILFVLSFITHRPFAMISLWLGVTCISIGYLLIPKFNILARLCISLSVILFFLGFFPPLWLESDLALYSIRLTIAFMVSGAILTLWSIIHDLSGRER